ncbi:hypothetical protein ACFPES_17800 [Paenibacillus sp. GCM10023248]|uniref:hypothetical protein n=1 Tax=Bacillales TaxID=1385 RepID=UPI002378906B|nr:MULTISPECIES: hypothetical protein [Bacillales]MDD9268898.1 hypothetical protein [Paenibacillus sp. MAHUQ-63]MDR6882023.1 hypothetical protein [Bacillus sp. 3255]
MKIYVILAFDGEAMENVYVGTDEEKALSLKPDDFENCDALFVEIWEDGEKTDDFRLVEETDNDDTEQDT